jgi:hypothetical protein
MEKNLTPGDFYSPPERIWLCRIVFLFIFFSLLYSLASNTLLHQIGKPVIKFPYVDLTYWVMHLLQIPEAITSHYVIAVAFDLLLFTTCILCFLYPNKRAFIIAFTVLYFIYFITFNTYGTHHTNPKIGVLLAPVPFVVRNNNSFNYLWQGLRYFLVFSYSSAFLWKFFRFTWLHNNQGILIMKKNLAGYLYFDPNSWLAGIYYWFLQHTAVVNALFIAGFILEGLFIIGLFTRKFDWYLFLLSLLLPLGFWFIADALFFELLILSITLLNLHPLLQFVKPRYTPR